MIAGPAPSWAGRRSPRHEAMQAHLHAPISERAAGNAGGPRPLSALRRLDGGRVLGTQLAVSALLGFAATAVWGLTGGRFYWPVWVWVGVWVPLGLHLAVRNAWRRPP